MPDQTELQRCRPTEAVPQLQALFLDIARSRERFRDGLAGAAAGAARGIRPVPVALPSKGATAAQQYAHYERILASRGIALHPTQPTVLALRGLNSEGTAHGTKSVPRYDDTMVVLKRDAHGQPQVTTLAGSTHPGSAKASVGGTVGVPDVSGDKKADVGMLEPGEYLLVRRAADHNGAEAWDVRTSANSSAVPGVRDTNQDGVYSAEERTASQAAGHTMTGVMIHQGADKVPQSAGCLNLSSESKIYPEFVTALGEGTESRKLVVLDANEK